MDGSELLGASRGVSFSGDIRPCTLEDVEWMVSVCDRLWDNIDKEDTRLFLTNCISHPACVVIRSANCAGAAGVVSWEYNQNYLIGEELFVGSLGKNPMEVIRIYKYLRDWTKERGAKMFKFSMSVESKNGKSLNPIAMRLGAVPANSNYVVRF